MKFSECVEIVGSKPSRYQGIKQYVSTGSLDSDHIDENSIEEYAYDDRPSRADLVAEAGNVLFAKMAETKKTLVINNQNEKYLFSTGFFAVKPKKNVLTTECLYYLLNSNTFLSQKDKYSSGATQKAISNASLEKIIVNIPCFSKQEDIVKQLDKLSNIIKKTRKQLLNFDLLIKSRFIEMFGDPLDNQKNWEVQTLGNLCEIVRGGSPRPIDKFLGGSIPWIKIGDATNGDDIYLYKTKEHIIEEGIKKSRLIPEGSLIFANCGVSLGFARIIKFQGCIHDGWLAFQNISPRVNNVFLLKSLNMCTDYFRKTAPDGTQPNLNTTIMKSFVQILPPKDLQDEYVQFVQQIDKSKFVVQKSLEKAETLYKSLMQEYFG